MTDKKYDIKNYRSDLDAGVSALTGLAGLVSTVYGLVTQDQETAIAGGALLTGGTIWNVATYIEAYVKAKFDYMNDNPRE